MTKIFFYLDDECQYYISILLDSRRQKENREISLAGYSVQTPINLTLLLTPTNASLYISQRVLTGRSDTKIDLKISYFSVLSKTSKENERYELKFKDLG